MTDIYRNTSHTVYLDIYGGTADAPPTARCETAGHEGHHLADLVVNGPETLEDGAQRWTATLGLVHTQYVEDIKVIWEFSMGGQPVQKVDWFGVVTPVVPLDDIREELEVSDRSDDELARAERRVRRIIERTCGQRFMHTHETVEVQSRGDRLLYLPKRALEVTSMTSAVTGLNWPYYEITNDGWALRKSSLASYEDEITVVGPIFNPFKLHEGFWAGGSLWKISGHWGWSRVPSAVQEAALILIEDSLCQESNYRNKYVSTMRSSDWSFEYDEAAFAGTGNVLADQLLSGFVVHRAAVV